MGTTSDNILQTLQVLVQDVIAPGVRGPKVRVKALRSKSIASRKANLAAIGEAEAQSESAIMAAVPSLRQRVALLEMKHN